MSSAAAAQLQRHIDGYVSTSSLDGHARRLLPNGNGRHSSVSHTVALDAAEVMHLISFSVPHTREKGGDDAAAPHPCAGAAVSVSPLQGNEGAWRRSSVLLYLADVVGRHLSAYVAAVHVDPACTNLGEAVDGGVAAAAVDNGVGSAPPCDGYGGGAGGAAVNFVAWVALDVYRLLARDAELRLRERRAVGGAAPSDAGVRTDAYLRWEREAGERLLAAAVMDQEPGEGASVEPCPAGAEPDDVFATHPSFFAQLVHTTVLPGVQRALHSRAAAGTMAGPLVLQRGRRALRRTGAQQPTCSPSSAALWLETASALCGLTSSSGSDSVLPTCGGGVVAASPAQTSVYVVAAVAASLAEPLLSAVCDWVDRLTPHADPSVPVRHLDTATEGRAAEVVQHALNLCSRAVQLVPFPMGDGADADMPLSLTGAGTAGGWLMPSTSSPLHVRPLPDFGLRRQRRAVVLPGLSIAATRIRSLAGGGRRDETADARTPAGTCVWSPPTALAAVSLVEADVADAAVHSSCDDAHALFTPVSAVAAARLHCVELLLLFETFPVEAATLAALRAALDALVRVGWVVVVVQAAVAKATQGHIEAEWGTASRPLLLLSAVGRWGLQQLALRFEVQPNTSATPADSLRVVRQCGAGSGASVAGAQPPRERRRPGGDCGLAAFPLRGQLYAPPSSLVSADAAEGTRGLRHPRYATAFTEVREHYAFVLGAYPVVEEADAPRDTPPASALSRSGSPTARSCHSSAGASRELGVPAQRPGAMSMRFQDNTTESSSSEASSVPSSHSSFSCLTDLPSSDGDEAAWMAAWYADDAGVPPFPFVYTSVLVGAATRAGMEELLYAVQHHWRLLLHGLVLPEALSQPMALSGAGGAVATAIRALDRVLCEQHTCDGASPGSRDPGEPRSSPSAVRAACALRDALWSYELLAVQHGPEAPSLDEAWRALQRYVDCRSAPEAATREEGDGTASAAAVESWLSVQCAYGALAKCLDELGRTVLLGSDAAATGLVFLPAL